MNRERRHAAYGLLLVVALIGAGIFLFGGTGEGGETQGYANGAVFVGAESDALNEACQEQFGSTWESEAWFPNNPPTVACTNDSGQTGYMDMPVDIQRDLDIVSTRNPNGTVNFVVNDETGEYND